MCKYPHQRPQTVLAERLKNSQDLEDDLISRDETIQDQPKAPNRDGERITADIT